MPKWIMLFTFNRNFALISSKFAWGRILVFAQLNIYPQKANDKLSVILIKCMSVNNYQFNRESNE